MIVSLEQAVKALKSDQVVAIPTETVYGLAAKISSEAALKNIFQIKHRPFFDPLIVHVNNVEQAKQLVTKWPNEVEILAKKFWPGPLTFVLPKKSNVSSLITSGLTTVGIRCPNHPMALDIIEQVGEPLAAPSANMFGKASPTAASHVEKEFDSKTPVVDGGSCLVGIESTVLLVNVNSENIEFSILRLGAISQKEIETTLGKNGISAKFTEVNNKQMSPGQLKHHYMPSVPLIVFKKRPNNWEQTLSDLKTKLELIPNEIEGVKIQKPSKLKNYIELSLGTDAQLAARILYQELRDKAELKPDFLFHILTNSGDDMMRAVNERLLKAATLVID